MRSYQDKALDEIERILLDGGLDPVMAKTYANCGTVFGLSGFESMIAIEFSFQNTYCSLHMSGPLVMSLALPDNPPAWRSDGSKVSWHALNYADGARVTEMLKMLADFTSSREQENADG